MIRYPFVLLDADNTLYDFDAAEHKALCKVLADRGYMPDANTLKTYLDINNALWDAFARGEVKQEFLLVERFRRFEEAMGGSHDPVQFNADYVKALGSNADLIPGALEFCRRLTELGCVLAIVTNGAAVAQRGRYAISGLGKYIPNLFISQELGVNKPDPLFFDAVCRKMGIEDRGQAVIVGDSLNSDILGGNQAGIDTVWFNPYHKPRRGPAWPTYTAAAYAEIEAMIAGEPAKE